MEKNRPKAKKIQWQLLFAISVAYIAVFANIQGFMGLIPLVRDEFNISRTQVGLYTSFYFLSAAIIAIFSGRIVDRLGTKKGLMLGVGLVGIMMVLHALSPYFAVILALSFLTGFAFSIITPSANKGVIEVAPAKKRSLFMGIVHGGGGLGGFLGASLLPFLGQRVGWRPALVYSSIFAILAAIFISRLYRPTGSQPQNGQNPSPEGRNSLKKDLSLLLHNRYLLVVCFMGIIFGMNTSSIGGHFTLYLNQDLGFDPALAGLGLGIFHIGGIIGQPCMGLINEKIMHGNSRKSLFLLGIIIAAFTLFFGLIISNYYFPPYAVLAVSFMMGFFTMGMIAIYFTAVTGLVSGAHVGVVTGLALIFIRTSVVIAPALFGLIADISGKYSNSWTILGAASLLFSLLFFFLSKKYLIPQEGRSASGQ